MKTVPSFLPIELFIKFCSESDKYFPHFASFRKVMSGTPKSTACPSVVLALLREMGIAGKTEERRGREGGKEWNGGILYCSDGVIKV